MTPIEWITLAQLVVVPLVTMIWREYRDRVQNEKLRALLDVGVRAAEEASASGKLNSEDKERFVVDLVSKKFPALAKDRPLLETMIRAACHAAGVGASAKIA